MNSYPEKSKQNLLSKKLNLIFVTSTRLFIDKVNRVREKVRKICLHISWLRIKLRPMKGKVMSIKIKQ